MIKEIKKILATADLQCAEGGDYSICRPVIANEEELAHQIQEAITPEGDESGLVDLEKAEGDLSFPGHIKLSPDAFDVIRLWALAYGDRVRKAQQALTRQENSEEELLFDLRWKADMRAIKMWRKGHPERRLVMPDHADMVCWLLEKLDAFDTTLRKEIVEHFEDLDKAVKAERERTIEFIDWLDNGTRSSASWRAEMRDFRQALKGEDK